MRPPITAGIRAPSHDAEFAGSTKHPPLQQPTFPLGLNPMYAELARTATKPVFTNEPIQRGIFQYIQIMTARQPAPDELLLEFLIAYLPEELCVEFALFQKWQPQHK